MEAVPEPLAKSLSITTWLDLLGAVLPAQGALVIGAGTGSGAVMQWLLLHGPDAACIVEGDERQYPHLTRTLLARPRWKLRRDVVASEPTAVVFHQASNPGESGLVAPSELRVLWPRLDGEPTTHNEMAVTLNAIAKDVRGQANWLIIDCLPAAALIKGGDEVLPEADLVIARVATEHSLGLPEEATLDAVREMLVGAGLRLVVCVGERHPALGLAIFVKDLPVLRNRNVQLKAHFETTAAAHQAEIRTRTEMMTLQAGLVRERDELRAQLEAEIAARATEAKALVEIVARYETLAEESSHVRQAIESSEAQLDTVHKSVEASIDREVTNAIRQIESFVALQGYLLSGDLPPALHGWPVSPDFALLLVQLLELEKFDAIIEFGSGSSTLIIAKTLDNIAKRSTQKNRPVQVALEHLEKYHAATSKILARAGLQDKVHLILAPLKNWKLESGEVFNYYSPGNSLRTSSISDLSNRISRILSVVDGPPASVGRLSRYPALELLLQTFPSHHGVILLDDYFRPDEREVVKRWQQMLEARGMAAEIIEHQLEKGACLIKYAPPASDSEARGQKTHDQQPPASK